MLKPYDKAEDIPEPLREHYSRREDGKYHADIPNDHPAVKHNATLLSEKTAAIAERDAAKSELESAKASGLPRGHEAVPKADADLVRTVKAAGITTTDAFNSMKDEHASNKTKVEAQERREGLDRIRRAEGWGEDAVDVLALIPDLPEVEQRDTDEKDDKGVPKKKNIAKVKGADGVVTEKPFADYFAEKHPALLPSVVAKKEEGTQLPAHGAGGGSTGEDLVEKRIKARDAARAAQLNPLVPQAKSVAATQ
jgi:hypothetical protein